MGRILLLRALRLVILGAALSCPGAASSANDGALDLGGPASCATDQCSDIDCCSTCSCFYASVEALVLDRDVRGSRPLVILVQDEASAFPGDTLLSIGDLDFDWQPGVRALFGWQRTEFDAWEIGYLGVFDWNASATLSGNNSLAIPGNLGLASLDFFAADEMLIDYNSELHSAECNYVRSYGVLSFLAGFRYASLDERFNLRSTDADTGTSDYRIRTSNDLYGGHAGLRWYRGGEVINWEATAKAGIFGNAASQTQFVTDFPPPFLLRGPRESSRGNVAFLGDMNLSAIYPLGETWSLRGGYNLLWIEGVALAPSQLDFTDTAASGRDITFNGLLMHGVNLGLEAYW